LGASHLMISEIEIGHRERKAAASEIKTVTHLQLDPLFKYACLINLR